MIYTKTYSQICKPILCGVDVIAQDKLGRLGLSVLGWQRDEMVLVAVATRLTCTMQHVWWYVSEISVLVEAHANTFRLAEYLLLRLKHHQLITKDFVHNDCHHLYQKMHQLDFDYNFFAHQVFFADFLELTPCNDVLLAAFALTLFICIDRFCSNSKVSKLRFNF